MRRSWVLVLVVALALLSPAAGGRGRAQDATPASLAGHPLVGAWILDTDAADPANPPALAAFTADGVYVQADADGSDGYGAWAATGERTADLTIVFHAVDEAGAVGSTTVRAAVEVEADGQALTATYTLEFAGEGAPAGEIGPVEATGERIGVEAMGTPAVSAEEAFGGGGTPEAATPAP